MRAPFSLPYLSIISSTGPRSSTSANLLVQVHSFSICPPSIRPPPLAAAGAEPKLTTKLLSYSGASSRTACAEKGRARLPADLAVLAMPGLGLDGACS